MNGGGFVIYESLACCALWAFLYVKSLKGGDLEEIKQIMGRLGGYLMASLLIFTYSIWRLLLVDPKNRASYRIPLSTGRSTSLNYRLGRAVRRLMCYWKHQNISQLRYPLITLHVLTLVCLWYYDRGVDFMEHGSYNMLIYILILIPLNLTILVILLWYRLLGFNRFVKSFIAFLFAFGVIIGLRLDRLMTHNELGFHGISATCQDCDCKFVKSIPWFDLLPNRAQTFWAGSPVCAKSESRGIFRGIRKAETFTADIKDEDYLHVTCPTNASYSILPDTRHWPFNWKHSQPDDNSLQDHILEQLEASTSVYPKKPVRLSEDQNTIIVKCGPDSKILTRVPITAATQAKIDYWSTLRGSTDMNKLPPNVLIIFLDAVARKQFFRRLPKTVKVLENISKPDGDFDLYQFFRYSIVGFNTNENTRAMFTGDYHKAPFYQEPIWKIYKDVGKYVTAKVYGHCEDWTGAYQRRGITQGTELDYEFEGMACLPEYEPVDWKERGNFKGFTAITARCMANKHFHDWELDYMRKFIDRFDGQAPWFLIGTFMEGHEGTGEVLSQIDASMAEFFADLKANHTLDNTILTVISDHGPHMGLNFLYLKDGMVSHRSPFLAISVPKTLETENDKENMRRNQYILNTSADVHKTLIDILYRYSPKPLPPPPHYHTNLNQTSLFDSLPNRSCKDIGIDKDFCLCGQ